MKIIILLATLTFSVITHAQDSLERQKDISIGAGLIFNEYTQVPATTLNLTFRQELKNNFIFKVGANSDFYNSVTETDRIPLFTSDSVLILGRSLFEQKQFSGRIGFDYKATRIVYAGVELKLGYTPRNIYSFADGYQLDTTGTWQNCLECASAFYGTEHINPSIDPSQTNINSGVPLILSESKKHLFNYGLMLNMGLDFPIDEKLNFAVQATMEVILYNTEEPFTNFQIPYTLNALLRYRI